MKHEVSLLRHCRNEIAQQIARLQEAHMSFEAGLKAEKCREKRP